MAAGHEPQAQACTSGGQAVASNPDIICKVFMMLPPDAAATCAQACSGFRECSKYRMALLGVGAEHGGAAEEAPWRVSALEMKATTAGQLRAHRSLLFLLASMPNLRDLRVSVPLFTEQHVVSLATAATGLSRLTLLHLTNATMSTVAAHATRRLLRRLLHLQDLDLSGNALGDSGMEVLRDALCHLPRLTHLDLSRNQLGLQAASALAVICVCAPALRSLAVEANDLGCAAVAEHGARGGAAAFAQMAELLHSFTALSRLRLSVVAEVADGVLPRLLFGTLSRLEALHVASFEEVPDDAPLSIELLEAVARLTRLTALSLRRAGRVDLDAAEALAGTLRMCTRLQHVDCSGCWLDPGAREVVGPAVAALPMLTHLCLGREEPLDPEGDPRAEWLLGDPDGYRFIRHMLHACTGLRHLQLHVPSDAPWAALAYLVALTALQLTVHPPLLPQCSPEGWSLQDAVSGLPRLQLAHFAVAGPCVADALTTKFLLALTRSATVTALVLHDRGVEWLPKSCWYGLAALTQLCTLSVYVPTARGSVLRLAAALTPLAALTALHVFGKLRLNPRESRGLAAALAHLRRLQQLQLSCVCFVESDAQAKLAAAVGNLRRLTHLWWDQSLRPFWMWRRRRPAGAPPHVRGDRKQVSGKAEGPTSHLATPLACLQGLQVLVLRAWRLSDFCSGLDALHTLTTLDVGGGRISGAAADALGRGLQGLPQLAALHLNRVRLEAGLTWPLVAGLATLTTLTRLSMAEAELGDADNVVRLAGALRNMLRLQVLLVPWNNLDDADVTTLAQALLHNSRLVRLHVKEAPGHPEHSDGIAMLEDSLLDWFSATSWDEVGRGADATHAFGEDVRRLKQDVDADVEVELGHPTIG